jgi:alkanesulfonate monooxygenase SsuD/methylene tetrahydromethanopterin reductase-like flavin-dependent oxidoreductase (luciferase family)
VLNGGFWVPALMAREAAALDVLSDGRLELCIGAGTVRDEFEGAGLPWRPAAHRIRRMEQTLIEVRTWPANEEHAPRPVQDPMPMLVGAMSRDGLRSPPIMRTSWAFQRCATLVGIRPAR